MGSLVEPPPWGVEGWPHVVWDGDDYMCVLRPEEVVYLDEERHDPPSQTQ